MNLVNGTSNANDNNDLLFVNFNQDCTYGWHFTLLFNQFLFCFIFFIIFKKTTTNRSLAVGTKTGYRLYTINSSEKLQETYSCG